MCGVSQTRRNWQMALYAVYLCAGGTHFFKRVTLSTIKQYMLHAATLVAHAIDLDPRKETAADTKFTPQLQQLLDSYKKWEGQPKRREPWTPTMQVDLDQCDSGFCFRGLSLGRLRGLDSPWSTHWLSLFRIRPDRGSLLSFRLSCHRPYDRSPACLCAG